MESGTMTIKEREGVEKYDQAVKKAEKRQHGHSDFVEL